MSAFFKRPKRNQGETWTTGEDEQLRAGYRQGLELSVIADQLGRSIQAIFERAVKMKLEDAPCPDCECEGRLSAIGLPLGKGGALRPQSRHVRARLLLTHGCETCGGHGRVPVQSAKTVPYRRATGSPALAKA